jgi:hypothetical protein
VFGEEIIPQVAGKDSLCDGGSQMIREKKTIYKKKKNRINKTVSANCLLYVKCYILMLTSIITNGGGNLP